MTGLVIDFFKARNICKAREHRRLAILNFMHAVQMEDPRYRDVLLRFRDYHLDKLESLTRGHDNGGPAASGKAAGGR